MPWIFTSTKSLSDKGDNSAGLRRLLAMRPYTAACIVRKAAQTSICHANLWTDLSCSGHLSRAVTAPCLSLPSGTRRKRILTAVLATRMLLMPANQSGVDSLEVLADETWPRNRTSASNNDLSCPELTKLYATCIANKARKVQHRESKPRPENLDR